MANSNRTTKFGPRVSFTTTKSDSGPINVHVPSTATLSVDGSLKVSGEGVYSSTATITFENVAPIKFSNITTASPTSTFIADGYLSVVSHSGNSMVIAIRSGATTYRWTNAAGGVL